MPRTAADATRFTATGPYANPQPGKQPAYLAFAPPAPPNETPREKVARLREAARKAKLSEISTFDKVIIVGRRWADRAHRITTFSLIGASAIAGIITAFALGDMVIYNRRKRNQWYDDQNKRYAQALSLAQEAAAQGRADENQIVLLDRERAAQEAEAERLATRGFFGAVKDFLYGGLTINEKKGGRVRTVNEDSDDSTRPGESVRGNGDLGILKAIDERRKKEAQMEIDPGPLDKIGAEVADAALSKSQSWMSWAKGR